VIPSEDEADYVPTEFTYRNAPRLDHGASSWTRSPRGPIPEPWRMVGRPFDPSRRGASEGEQRHGAAERALWGATGAAGALAALWLAWSVFVR